MGSEMCIRDSLGIIDELTEGKMTGGVHFAGTGTIESNGDVGSIGGIAQKMVGAKDAGATVFLAPADNCDEVVGHIPDGLSVVKVSNLTEAADAVKKIGAGEDPSTFPTCTAESKHQNKNKKSPPKFSGGDFLYGQDLEQAAQTAFTAGTLGAKD